MFVVTVFSFSATLNEDEFRIIRDSAEETCKLCYGFDCTALTKPRCGYYGDVYDSSANVEDAEQDNDLNEAVGNMIQQYVDKARTEPYEDCLPLISQYTNCNKENICGECKICSCDVFGRWDCSSVQHCLTDNRVVADHRVLVVVMDKLQKYKKLHSIERFKRSTNEINKKMSYQDLINWMYGIESSESEVKNGTEITTNETNINKNNGKRITIDIGKNQSSDNNSESDVLSFDDLLSSVIGHDNHININNSQAMYYKNGDPFSFDLLREIDINYITEANDININEDKSDNKTNVSLNTPFTKTNSVETENSIFSFNEGKENILNINKREAPSGANETDLSLPINYNNTIDKIEELQKNVLSSLNKIVNEKQNELEKLTNIKENLIFYLKSFGNISISNDTSNNSTNNENSTIHLYQFEAIQIQEDLRKSDSNILEKYLKKLKRDIYVVIRDIAAIQRLSNTSIPRDLGVLIRSMRHYVNEENKKTNKTHLYKALNSRKHLNSHTDKHNNQLVDIISNILEVLDKDAPTGDILVTVSRNFRQIIKRIIKTFYTDDVDISDSKIFDPEYNILNYLTSIGNKWQKFMVEMEQSSIQDHLYNLKSLHMALSKDILKMNDALKLIEFANNRRMATNDRVIEEKVVFKLSNDLHQMENRIRQIIMLQPNQHNKYKNKNTLKKKTLFQKIKKMLKSSKNELRKLFHRNVSNSELVRHMAKKKMNEITKKKMSDYEKIMQKWQNNLKVMPVRNKRSAGFRKFMYDIKHLFAPRYSRSKAKKVKNKKNGTVIKATTKRTKHRSRAKKKKVILTTRKPVLFRKIKN